MNMFCNGYNNLVTVLAARTADALGVTLSTKLVDKLIREATEIVVMDWCEFDYGCLLKSSPWSKSSALSLRSKEKR